VIPPGIIFFTFLLLSYIGNTFGCYGQNNSIQRPGINVTLPEQRHKINTKIQSVNKSLVCPYEGSVNKKETLLPDRSALSYVWGFGPKFRPHVFFFGVSSIGCGLLSGGLV
jgi:hypothetical protein